MLTPADEDLSAQSLSPNTSLADERTDDPDRSSTPSQYLQVPESETPAPFVPRGVDENGVRGILRASGAPGSGNGGMSLLRSLCLSPSTPYVRRCSS